MEPVVTSALIGAGASALAGGTSAVAQSSLNKKTREFNREEAEKQRQWNEAMAEKQNAWNYEMWMKQNEYNDPTHQVQRLRDAGLNPLYYGLDGSSAGALTAAQPLGYERARADNQANPITAGIGAVGELAQAKLAEASAGRAEKEADLIAEKTITEQLMRGRQYDLLGVQIDLGKSQEYVNEKQAKKLAAEIHSVEKQVEKMDADIIETYSRIDVAQRGQKLAEDSFEFSKALSQSKLSLEEKAVAIQWYNANTQRLIGDADIALKKDQQVYLALEGDQVKAVTATEDALRAGKVERQGIENKTAEREYKWMPVDKTVKAVGAAAGIAGAVMLGGKGAAVGKVASAAAPVSRGSYTTLYGPDGNSISRNTW